MEKLVLDYYVPKGIRLLGILKPCVNYGEKHGSAIFYDVNKTNLNSFHFSPQPFSFFLQIFLL